MNHDSSATTATANPVASRITTGDEPIDLENFSDNAIVRIHLRGQAQLTNGKTVEITMGKLRRLLDTKLIVSRNNTLFLKHEVKPGVVAQWCKYFYEYRKSVKKEMAKVSKQVYDGEYKNDAEKNALEDRVKSLHDLQLSVKLQLNSVYGILGTPYSAIYNPDIAQSITRNGKFCNINSSKFIAKRFKELFGTTDEYPTIPGGDTDSCIDSTMLRVKYDIFKFVRSIHPTDQGSVGFLGRDTINDTAIPQSGFRMFKIKNGATAMFNF